MGRPWLVMMLGEPVASTVRGAGEALVVMVLMWGGWVVLNKGN
jgi:hypothetical protein